jgi:hypothetical protein
MSGNFNDIIQQVMAMAQQAESNPAMARQSPESHAPGASRNAGQLAAQASSRELGPGYIEPGREQLEAQDGPAQMRTWAEIIMNMLAANQPDSNNMQGGYGPTTAAGQRGRMRQ